MRFVPALIAILGVSCVTRHDITLRPDRSVLVRNSTTCTGADVREYYHSPAVQMIDTAFLGQSIVVLNDIDSLGNYLPTFTKGQFTFALRGNELTIRAAHAPLKRCWSLCRITLFAEQGIKSASGSKRLKPLDPYVILSIGRRRLAKEPETLNAVVVLAPVK